VLQNTPSIGSKNRVELNGYIVRETGATVLGGRWMRQVGKSRLGASFIYFDIVNGLRGARCLLSSWPQLTGMGLLRGPSLLFSKVDLLRGPSLLIDLHR
jgi:hypothetical protein